MDAVEEQRALLIREIARIVAKARVDGRLLRAAPHAVTLLSTYPDAHLSMDRILDEIVIAASAAKVPVEIAHPESA